jgi:hypothetical protein
VDQRPKKSLETWQLLKENVRESLQEIRAGNDFSGQDPQKHRKKKQKLKRGTASN